MALRRPDKPLLVCPACKTKHGGAARIGNRKTSCTLCNRFAQRVRRQVTSTLMAAYPARVRTITKQAERAAYNDLLTELAEDATDAEAS